METRETQESLTREFAEMVNKNCNIHQLIGWPAGESAEQFLGTRSRGLMFGRKSILGSREIKWNISNLKLWVEQIGNEVQPFNEGCWSELNFIVFDAKYFLNVSKLASQYEKTTGKKVIILKKF
jgi:hypothetical protein